MDSIDISDRLKLDFESVCEDIESILADISALRNERLFSQAIGDDAMQKLKEHEIAVKKRLSDAFSLVVIGDFKRGKSTLINAMLGEELLPAAVTPETVTVNRLSYAESPKAEAILENGRRVALDYSELKRDILERLLPQLPASIDYIDVRANNDLLVELSIVDTPGIGDLMNAFDEKVAGYLVNADALTYVISARAPLSATEQAFLASAVIPQSFSRIMLVVNMADTLETEENIAKIEAISLERAGIFGENVPVYMLSALDELCRKKGVSRPEPDLEEALENNFLEFESALRRDIVLQKDIIKSMRGISLMEMMLRDISARIGLVKNSISAGIDDLYANVEDFQNQDSELRKGIDRHKTAMASDVEGMKSEAKRWIAEFMERLKAELHAIQGSASMSDIERHFQFYLMDSIRNAVNVCVQHHQQEISAKASNAIKEMAQEATQQIFGSIDSQVADCITDVSWTSVDTAMFSFEYADQFIGISNNLGPLYLVGQAVMGFMRQKKLAGMQTDFISPVLNDFDAVTTEVADSMTKIYDRLKYGAMDIIEESYRKQAEASVSAIKKAREIMQDETASKEEVITYLNTVLERIGSFKQLLGKYK